MGTVGALRALDSLPGTEPPDRFSPWQRAHVKARYWPYSLVRPGSGSTGRGASWSIKFAGRNPESILAIMRPTNRKEESGNSL